MKDPQIKEILTFWYSRQEGNVFSFKFHRDDKLNGKKRSRDYSDSDSNADADSKAEKPSHRRTRLSQKKNKGKGKGKRVEKSEERWTDNIVPDLRQHKRRAITLSEDKGSGKVFDFALVNQMKSSEEDTIPLYQQPKAGPRKTPILTTKHSIAKRVHQSKALTGKSTMAPLSKQRNRCIENRIRMLGHKMAGMLRMVICWNR